LPLIALRTTVLANATAFPLTGQQYEFMHEHCTVEIAVVAAATGILATVYSGPDLLQQEGQVTIKAANSAPVYPDDYHLEDDAAAGDRLSVQLRNTTGANIDVFTYIKITPED
jgi:hypothetical protein